MNLSYKLVSYILGLLFTLVIIFIVLVVNEVWHVYGTIVSQVEPSVHPKRIRISEDRRIPIFFEDREFIHKELAQLYYFHDKLWSMSIPNDILHTIKIKENKTSMPPNIMFFTRHEKLFIILRSTKSNYEIYHDMKITQKYIKKFGWIHYGIGSIYGEIRDELLEYITINYKKYKEIIVFGHSFGGALASILAYDLMLNYEKIFLMTRVFSSGAPRVFEPKIVDFMETHKESNRHVSIVNNADAICNIPISSTKNSGKYWFYKSFTKHRIFFNKVFKKKPIDSHVSSNYSIVLWNKDAFDENINYTETF